MSGLIEYELSESSGGTVRSYSTPRTDICLRVFLFLIKYTRGCFIYHRNQSEFSPAKQRGREQKEKHENKYNMRSVEKLVLHQIIIVFFLFRASTLPFQADKP